MDKKQLVTIAVTALISVVAKEVVTWILSLAKSQTLKSVIKEKAKSTLTKKLLTLTWFLIWFSGSLWMLIFEMRGQGPVTRVEVLNIFVSSIGTFAAAVALFVNVLVFFFQRRLSRQLEAAKTLEEKVAMLEQMDSGK